MKDTTARGNRLGLLLVGLTLLALAASAIARGAGVLPQDAAPARAPLVDAPARAAFARYDPSLWWVIAAGGIVLALFGARWLLVQGRRRSLDTMRLEGGPAGVTEVDTGGVTDAASAEAGAHPAILGATATMVGTERHPCVRMRVTLAGNAPMSVVREQLGEVVLPHVRQALESPDMPAVARVHVEDAPRPRRTLA